MPKISPLGSAARKAAEYDRQTEEINELIHGRIAVRHLTHEDLASVLGKTRSAVSYSLKDIDRMRFGDIRRLCDALDLEIAIRKKT